MSSEELVDKAVAIIKEKVRPTTLPLGIKMLKSQEELPQKVKMPSKLGNRWALCQALFAARNFGWMVALGPDDQACPVVQILLGFRQSVPFYTEGNLSHGMYTETLNAGAVSEEALPRFKYGEYEYVLIAPLETFSSYPPDIVCVYGMPGQITRLIQSAVYRKGGALTSSFTGRGGCVGMIAGTMQKNACQVVVNGNGERVFGHAQDNEMSFTIPWSQLEDVLDGLEGTHKGGVRYPFPSFVNFTPAFPPKYYKLEELWEPLCSEKK